MAARLIIASLCISACSSVGVEGPSRPPQKARVERTLDSTESPSITAFIRHDASDDATRDLAVSVGKMQGVETAEISYAAGTIKVFMLSSATSEETGRIRDYLSSSNIVTRVE
jgi:hypothetical protein